MDGFPKNMNDFPGCSFACIYLMPLKNTTSICALSSAMMTLNLLIEPGLADVGSTDCPDLLNKVVERTVPLTCT